MTQKLEFYLRIDYLRIDEVVLEITIRVFCDCIYFCNKIECSFCNKIECSMS